MPEGDIENRLFWIIVCKSICREVVQEIEYMKDDLGDSPMHTLNESEKFWNDIIEQLDSI